MFFEEQLETETVFKGKIVNVRHDVVKLQNGNKAWREVVEHPGGVCVVAVTKDKKVLMVRQFRYTMEEELLEIPAGKLEHGEEPFSCAVRELSEETGYTAEKWIDFGVIYPSPGVYRERLYQYLALDLTPGEMHLDENELLSVEEIDIDELIEKIMSHEIKDAKSVIGIMKAKRYLFA
ncbi:MAG: NUDIX hydrolase [Oscillospiraceae bacterium]|jgi:ADP-ribose pyrophosphatase|nr:NUDIX hydrolase [Oscillospiraceae bacterium]